VRSSPTVCDPHYRINVLGSAQHRAITPARRHETGAGTLANKLCSVMSGFLPSLATGQPTDSQRAKGSGKWETE
jgi:hypothetical protein